MQLAGEFMLQSTLESVICFGSAGGESLVDAFAWGYVEVDEGRGWEQMSVEELEADVDSQLEFDETGMILDDDFHATESRKEEKVEKWEGEEMVNLMFKADDDDNIDEKTSQRSTEQLGGSEVEGWKEVRDDFLKLVCLRTTNTKQQPKLIDTQLEPAPGCSLLNHLVQTAAEHPIVDFEGKVIGYLEALSKSIEAPILVQLEQGRLAALNNSIEETNKFKQKVGLGHWVSQTTTA